MTDFDRKYKLARKKVKAKKGFYFHLTSFILTGIFFFIVNMIEDPTEIWFPIPLAAWGIGLGFHYVGVFGFPGKSKILSAEWEKNQLDKELSELGVFEEDTLDLNNPKEFETIRSEKQKDWKDDDLV